MVAIMYCFLIRNGDGPVREDLGCCTMDAMQGERKVCSIAFP